MDIVLHVFALLWFTTVIACLWMLHCNNRTHDERRAILDEIGRIRKTRNLAYASLMLDRFGETTYRRHLAMRFFLLDPSRLYPPALRRKP